MIIFRKLFNTSYQSITAIRWLILNCMKMFYNFSF